MACVFYYQMCLSEWDSFSFLLRFECTDRKNNNRQIFIAKAACTFRFESNRYPFSNFYNVRTTRASSTHAETKGVVYTLLYNLWIVDQRWQNRSFYLFYRNNNCCTRIFFSQFGENDYRRGPAGQSPARGVHDRGKSRSPDNAGVENRHSKLEVIFTRFRVRFHLDAVKTYSAVRRASDAFSFSNFKFLKPLSCAYLYTNASFAPSRWKIKKIKKPESRYKGDKSLINENTILSELGEPENTYWKLWKSLIFKKILIL